MAKYKSINGQCHTNTNLHFVNIPQIVFLLGLICRTFRQRKTQLKARIEVNKIRVVETKEENCIQNRAGAGDNY